jgi:hypothetical protein
MGDENIKEYGDHTEVAHVIGSTGDAIEAVTSVMEAVDMDSQDVSLCVLKFIDKTFKDGKKGLAVLLVIDELSGVIPKELAFTLTVDGKSTSIRDYIRSHKDKHDGGSIADKLKDILGD